MLHGSFSELPSAYCAFLSNSRGLLSEKSCPKVSILQGVPSVQKAHELEGAFSDFGISEP
jgi:hypothetical protein